MKFGNFFSSYIAIASMILILNSIVWNALAQDGKTLNSIKKTKVLKVCTSGGFIPFSVHGKDGWEGFDIDMAKRYSDFINVKLEVIDYHFDGIIPALNTKKCDLIASGMTITSDRKKSVLFSEPYFKDGLSYLYKKKNVKFEKISDINMLNKSSFKLGVKVGYTSDFYVSKNLKEATVLKYNETGDIINALRNNKIDAIITDTNHAKILQKKFNDLFEYKNTNVQDEYYGVAARLNDNELMKSFNLFLSIWKSSGEYDRDYEKNFK